MDDPSSWPERFPTEETQGQERQRLFRIIEQLVKWENSTNEHVLNAARFEIARSIAADRGWESKCRCHGTHTTTRFTSKRYRSGQRAAQDLGLQSTSTDPQKLVCLLVAGEAGFLEAFREKYKQCFE